MRLLELASIIDFEQRKLGLSKDTKSTVRNGCGPLLEILEDETVSVIHHSFTEFLFDQERWISQVEQQPQFPRLDSARSQRTVALTCLSFLTESDWSKEFETENPMNRFCRRSDREIRNIKLKYPFLDYAATNWYRHVVKYDALDHDLLLAIDNLMDTDLCAFQSWLAFHCSADTDLCNISWFAKSLTPMHTAAMTGLSHYICHLTSKGSMVDEPGDLARTPLSRAAEKGHEQTVKALLDCGAKKDHDDEDGMKPLLYAAQNNHWKVVDVLLQAGVDPLTPKTTENHGRRCGNAATTRGDTAVRYACESDHSESVHALMPYLDSAALHDALYWAALKGSAKVVALLLQHPQIDVNRSLRKKTALFLASAAQDVESMQLLLDKGADINPLSHPYTEQRGRRYDPKLNVGRELSTPLHGLASSCVGRYARTLDAASIKRGFRMLVQAGCDVSALDASGQTALSIVIRSVRRRSEGDPEWLEDVIRYLLEKGASATGLLPNGSNLLHSYKGPNPAIMRLLLEEGVDPNLRTTNDGRSPLMTTKNLLLLQHRADLNLADHKGWTILHLLLTGYREDISALETVLKAGADPNAKTEDGATPLHFATTFPNAEATALLLRYGAEVDARDNRGQTPFHRSCQSYQVHYQRIEQLVAASADVHAVNGRGATGLQMIFETYNPSASMAMEKIKYLTKQGIDPLRTDHGGNTLFHALAGARCTFGERDLQEFVDLVLRQNVSPKQTNHHGQLPLHFAIRNRNGTPSTVVLDFLLGSKCGLGINAADHRGVCPIHIAATCDEAHLSAVLTRGADPSLSTCDGQTPLMIASERRQSNMVGMLLDYLKLAGKAADVNSVDKQGRSALHYACTSGRRESVKILLEAGADPDVKDKAGKTPLCACTEFPAKNASWKQSNVQVGSSYGDLEEFITLDGGKTPAAAQQERSLGVRSIIRLLVDHGADISFLQHPETPLNPLSVAINLDFWPMIDELLSLKEGMAYNMELAQDQSRNKISAKRTLLCELRMSDIVRSAISEGLNPLEALCELVKLESENGVRELAQCDVDFVQPYRSAHSLVEEMVSQGLNDMLDEYGSSISKVTAEWAERTVEAMKPHSGWLNPILHVACQRQLPNLDVIQTLVEKFGVNVNQNGVAIQSCGGLETTALHILAYGSHWWHRNAVEYLIQKGADIEARNTKGETPLMIASKQSTSRTPSRFAIFKFLLQAGANPHAADVTGNTALAYAAGDVEHLELFLKYGLDASREEATLIFSAIRKQDLASLRLLLDNGADCNAKRFDDPTGNFNRRSGVPSAAFRERFSYPLQLAASSSYPIFGRAAAMIEVLLANGADPLRIADDGNPIIHEIASSTGPLEPFLRIPHLDFEARDIQGKTILLAVCCRPFPHHKDHPTLTGLLRQLLALGACVTAHDNDGRNAIHLILQHHHRSPKDFVKEMLGTILAAPGGAGLALDADNVGSTAIHYAMRHDCQMTIDFLLSYGADITKPDPKDASTAWHRVIRNLPEPDFFPAREPYLKLILESGIDINARDHLGETPAFCYISGNSPDSRSNRRQRLLMPTLHVLEEAGADFTVRNKRGESLLHRLAERVVRFDGGKDRTDDLKKDLVTLFTWLVEKGCEVAWEDEDQRTALDVAAAARNEVVLEMFRRKQ